MQFAVSMNGVDGFWDAVQATSIDAIVANAERIQLRTTRLAATGAIAYYYKLTGSPKSSEGWIADGVASLPSGALWNGTEALDIGAHAAGNQQPCAGRIYRVILMDGINGTVLFDAPFDEPKNEGQATILADPDAAVVTLQGNASLISPAAQAAGDYLLAHVASHAAAGLADRGA
jgi:hypothetical protein